MMARMTKYIALVLLAVFTTSCSSTKLAVDWADTFLAWRIDETFDLSREQKKQIRPQLNQAVGNIKKEMFPQYSAFLLESKKELEGIDNKARADLAMTSIEKKMEGQLNLTLQKIQPQLVAMSQNLKPGNWKEFKEDYQERNEELLEDGPKPRLKKRIEQWVGSLNKDQRNKVEEFEKTQAFPVQIRVQNRTATLKKFEEQAQVTGASIDHQKFAQALSSFAQDYRGYQTPEYNEAMTKYRTNLKNLFAELYLSLDQKQKAKLFANLEKRAADLKQLAN